MAPGYKSDMWGLNCCLYSAVIAVVSCFALIEK